MADKEATVYIVDVGASMAEKRLGRDESDLEWAMLYVWDRITSTIATGRKTAKVGVVGLRTDGTANVLDNDESFHHISVLQNIDQILMRDLSKLRAKIKPSKTDDGDAISALVIAIQMISDHCKKLKYRRKIVLVSNGRGSMDDDGLEDIMKKITDDNIELVVLGVDFDDPEFGFKEEGKDPIKLGNEKLLRDFTDAVGGVFGTLAQAIAEMAAPRVKTVKPVRLFAGKLTLGDPESKEKMIEIDVERYPRTHVAKAPSASSFTLRSDVSNGTQASQASFFMPSGGTSAGADDAAPSTSNLVLVRNDRKYQVDDPGAPGGKRLVEREELAKGYEYGRTAVHLTESDENVTKLATRPGLQIVGFVPRQKYQRYFDMSVACVIVAGKVNNRASMALSSLIHALFELDSYAVARLVTKEDKPPLLVLLAPSIEEDYECLIDVQLPFAEDVRPYRFPPLDKILTVSGKVLTEHPNLPDKNLQAAMSDYVDRMDLSRFGKDDNGNPTEYMALTDTYSPVLHRIDQAIRWRAVHPKEPIPPAPEILVKFSRTPEELQSLAQADLKKLIAAAAIEKVPPKPKGQKRKRETARPVSGLDVDALLGRERHASGTGSGTGSGTSTPGTSATATTISADNCVPEFKQALATARDPAEIERATRQMGDAIVALIRRGHNSPAGAGAGGDSYGRVLEALRVMREELVAYEEPRRYNEFVRGLKAQLLAADGGGSGGLGGGSDDRRELWWQARRARLGLVTQRESDESDATEEEGMQFLVASTR